MSLIPASYIANKWRSTMARIDTGTLTFIAPDGEVTKVVGANPGPVALFQINDWDVLRRSWRGAISGWARNSSPASWQTDDIET